MPCRDCSAPAKSSRPSADNEGVCGRAHRLISTMLPEGFALLSSSCCWLPVCSMQTCTGFPYILTISRLCLTLFLLVLLLQLACKSCDFSFWPFLSWLCPPASRVKASAVVIFGAQSFVLVYWSGRSIVSGFRVIIAVTDFYFFCLKRAILPGCLNECSGMGRDLIYQQKAFKEVILASVSYSSPESDTWYPWY